MQPILSERRTGNLLPLLRSGELDPVLACAPIEDPMLTSHRLFFEPFVLAHPPDQVPHWPPVAGSDRFVLLEEGHCLRDQTLAACGPILPISTRHATGLEMLRHMVAAGEGLSLMPALAAAALGPIDGLVTYSPVPAADSGRHVVMLVRATDPPAPRTWRASQSSPGPAFPIPRCGLQVLSPRSLAPRSLAPRSLAQRPPTAALAVIRPAAHAAASGHSLARCFADFTAFMHAVSLPRASSVRARSRSLLALVMMPP